METVFNGDVKRINLPLEGDLCFDLFDEIFELEPNTMLVLCPCGEDAVLSEHTLERAYNVILNDKRSAVYTGDVELNVHNLLSGKFTCGAFVVNCGMLKSFMNDAVVDVYSLLLLFCNCFVPISVPGVLTKVKCAYEIEYTMVRRYVVDSNILVEYPKIKVIIPTKNLDNLKRCLLPIMNTIEGSDVIVAIKDDISSEDILKYCETVGISVYIYSYDFNYSRIHNDIIEELEEMYVVLINDDVIINNLTLENLFAAMLIDDKVGIVGAKLLYENNTIQHAGVEVKSPRGANHINKGLTRDHKAVSFFRTDLAVTFALVLINTEIYCKIGGMDEALDYDYNDIDYCIRCKNSGYKVLYSPEVTAYHLESQTRELDGKCGVDENSFYFKMKHSL